jgi:hypothetical protein
MVQTPEDIASEILDATILAYVSISSSDRTLFSAPRDRVTRYRATRYDQLHALGADIHSASAFKKYFDLLEQESTGVERSALEHVERLVGIISAGQNLVQRRLAQPTEDEPVVPENFLKRIFDPEQLFNLTIRAYPFSYSSLNNVLAASAIAYMKAADEGPTVALQHVINSCNELFTDKISPSRTVYVNYRLPSGSFIEIAKGTSYVLNKIFEYQDAHSTDGGFPPIDLHSVTGISSRDLPQQGST